VNIMHHGFPHRCILRDLRARFQKLLPPEFAHYSDRDFMHAVMLAWEIDDHQWTLGTSRLFLKAGQLRALEELRDIGGQASQQVIKKIRQQFAMKKLRAYAHAVELVFYLQRVMLQGKRERTYAGLRRAIRFMVRINRWKNRALKRLVPFSGMDEQQEAIFTRKLGVGFQTMTLNLSAAMLPQLFVTMGAADMPLIHSKMQKEMTTSEYDASWQAEAQESILYFNDGVLKCAKLVGGAFVPTARTSAGALCDVKTVDCCNTGRAFPVSSDAEVEKITCICQSPENSQMFAHCERSNTIMLWRWMGTTTKANQPAVAAVASFKLPAYWQVFQMCFLPKPAPRAGEHVIAVLGRMHDCNWLAISVYTVSRGRIILNAIKNVYLNLLDEAVQNEGASISHFNLSQSGRTLILAGNRLLRLYSVCHAANGIELEDLDPSQDCEAHILGRDPHGTVTAVCALPMDPESREGFLDWIWLGVSSGDMFGILLEEHHGTISVATSSGRFRRNTHSQGVAIQAIVAVHEPLEGDPRSLHHSLTMRKPMINPNTVLSISADGKLLHSERNESKQWQPISEWHVPLSSEALRCGFATKSSALIPQVLLMADEGRQCLIAYDQRQPVNSGMSIMSFV